MKVYPGVVCLFFKLQYCITVTDNEMICTTPRFDEAEIPDKTRRWKHDGRQEGRGIIIGALNDPGSLDFYAIFEMDGVETYLGPGNLTDRYMLMYPNPEVFPFEENRKVFRTYKGEKHLEMEVSDALPVCF